MPALLAPKNVALLTGHKVFSESELRSRYEIMMENYVKTVTIEGLTMVDMTRKLILPAVDAAVGRLAETTLAREKAAPGFGGRYEKATLTRLASLTDRIDLAVEELDRALIELKSIPDITEEADFVRDTILVKMAELRLPCDEAEALTPKEFWPFPTYGDLLFGVR